MKNKLLIITGVTATGKTSLGLKLARLFKGEVISADSRQVYIGMDIGTGKDIPDNLKLKISNIKINSKKINFYGNGTRMWGYDLVEPNEDFSLAEYKKVSCLIIKDIWKRKKTPIVIGGTGLYLKALTQPIDTIGIPPDKKLRVKLNNLSLEKLQIKLKRINPEKFESLNQSDRNNPRRLIRAIELSQMSQLASKDKVKELKIDSILWIGLKAPQKIIYKNIDKRVEKRKRLGAEQEIKSLLKKGYSFNLPSFSAMGYRQWEPYIKGKSTIEEIIERWKLDEHAYARRQMTWFKKNKKINWFNINKPDYQKNIVKLVSEWYSE